MTLLFYYFLTIGRYLFIDFSNVAGDQFIYPEFNVIADVEAYKIIVDAATPSLVTIVPSSQTSTYLNITKVKKLYLECILNVSSYQYFYCRGAIPLTNVGHKKKCRYMIPIVYVCNVFQDGGSDPLT